MCLKLYQILKKEEEKIMDLPFMILKIQNKNIIFRLLKNRLRIMDSKFYFRINKFCK